MTLAHYTQPAGVISQTIPVNRLSPIILLPALIPSADLITRIPAPSPKPEQREFKHRGLNI